MHEMMGKIVDLARERLKRGETNVKGFLFWCMVKAQTEEMEIGVGGNVLDAIARGAREAAEEAYGILRMQVVVTPTESLMGSPGDLAVDWDALVSFFFFSFGERVIEKVKS